MWIDFIIKNSLPLLNMLTIILAHPESNPDGKREFKIDKNTQCLKFLFQKKVKYNILLKLSKNEDIYFFKPYFLLKSKREFFIFDSFILLWRRSLSYRHQSIDLLCKSLKWILYDRVVRHERVKTTNLWFLDETFNRHGRSYLFITIMFHFIHAFLHYLFIYCCLFILMLSE